MTGPVRLAPDGVWQAAASPRRWWALTPPFHPYRRRLRRCAGGGLLSVPLSVGFRRLALRQRPALWCPDFPRAAPIPEGRRRPRSPGLRGQCRPGPPPRSGVEVARRRATPTPASLPRRRASAIVRRRHFGGLRRRRGARALPVFSARRPQTGHPGATPPPPAAEGSPRPSLTAAPDRRRTVSRSTHLHVVSGRPAR